MRQGFNSHRIASRSERGFTLVELLIVIGIIAVLIAILLPALIKARDSANTLACMSNMRQLVNLTMIYVDENRGWFPHSTHDQSSSPDPHRQDQIWADYITSVTTPLASSSPLQLCPVVESMQYDSNLNRLIWQGQDPALNTSAYEATPWITINGTLATRDDYYVPANPGPPSNCVRPTSIQHPTQVMLVIDSDAQQYAGGYYPAEHLRWRHHLGKAINLTFMDGHGETWDYSFLSNPATMTTKANSAYATNLLYNTTQFLPWSDSLVP